MNISKLFIPDLYLIKLDVCKDKRGSFIEMFNSSKFNFSKNNIYFKQDNLVNSNRNVLRGLHFQNKYPQGKLIQCIKGEIFDVCVDLRLKSTTYGKWYGQILSEKNNYQLFIPEGCAHGYCVISKNATVYYKCTEIYHPEDEDGIAWNDPFLKIDWPCDAPILSDKDKDWPLLELNNEF